MIGKINYHIDTLPFSKAKGHPFKYENGVILSKIPYTQEYHHHVTSIASFAIQNYSAGFNSKAFDIQIRWLLKNMNGDGAYVHNFTFPFYNNFPKRWIGGLAQGLAISALTRAGEIKAAEKAFNAMKNNCVWKDNLDYLWIEEYPLKPPARILNGFIYALFGVYDIREKTKSQEARDVLIEGITTLEHNLNQYDLGKWSKYDLYDELPATKFYNTVHVKQLYALYKLTKKPIFKQYADKWNTDKCPLDIKIMRVRKIIKKNGIAGCWKKRKQRNGWLKSK